MAKTSAEADMLTKKSGYQIAAANRQPTIHPLLVMASSSSFGSM
jgi:hypothetical protein